MTAAAQQQRNLLPEDMAKGRLEMLVPRTPGEVADCLRRRDRYRRAICSWAVGRARADWFGFHAGREAVRMVRLLRLTAAEDEKIRARAVSGASKGRRTVKW